MLSKACSTSPSAEASLFLLIVFLFCFKPFPILSEDAVHHIPNVFSNPEAEC